MRLARHSFAPVLTPTFPLFWFRSTLGLPVGLGLNFVINGKPYAVPMAVEEPSVVAAASNAAKTIALHSEAGGFVASHSDHNIMIAQVQVLDLEDARVAADIVRTHFPLCCSHAKWSSFSL